VTDQLFATPSAPAPPLLPAERIGRWVLHRAGINNVWQYDRTELSFGGGRVLLRGKNGAGKSKALEILLPFLLDGDTRSIDATGRDRTSVLWLMTDGRDAGNHVGYAWLELRLTSEDGEERFCTLGAGLKASSSNRVTATWFFLTETSRVGVDLHLGPDVSTDRLREVLGSDAVTATGTEHRRRVGLHLFGLDDPSRYSNLLHLLHRLRDPNIGNKIEAGELAAVLRSALPPPAETALERAAERFETLEEVREQLERTQRTAIALGRFSETYTGYARTVLRDRSQAVVDADGDRRRAERDASRLARAVEEATAAHAAAESRVQRLHDQERQAVREMDGLRSSEAYQHHQDLLDRRRVVVAKESAARSSEDKAAELERVARDAAEDAQRALARTELAERRVSQARPGLVELAKGARIDPAVVPRDADGIALAVEAANGRRRVAEQVRQLAEVATEARRRAERADEHAARSEQELSEREAQAEESQLAWVAASRTWRSEIETWWQNCFEGTAIAVPDAGLLRRSLGDGPAGIEELTAVASAARQLLAPLQESARTAESKARSARDEAEQLLAEKDAERAELEASAEARPEPSRYSSAERDDLAGAPFYELVDVVPGLSPAERSGLEAALEASGLLDAWVANDGLVIHPATRDVILRVDARQLPDGVPTLAGALVATRTDVDRLLHTVALGESDDCPWVTLDGRWSLGPLRGAWSKAEEEFLGAGTRRKTRERRLAELTARCAELRLALELMDVTLQRAAELRQHLDRLPSTLPTEEGVRTTSSRAEARAEAADAARSRHEVDRRAAERDRTAAAQAAAAVAHTAAGESLPIEGSALDAVIRAARMLVEALRAWEVDWSDLSERRADAESKTQRSSKWTATAAVAVRAAESTRREHDDEVSTLAALEQALASTVAEVLAAIEGCERRRRDSESALPSASEQASELATRVGQALAQSSAGADSVVSATELVEVVSERLLKVAGLPGVSEAALGTDWARDTGDTVAAARALRTKLGDGAAVSDQIVLNRHKDLEEGLAGGYDVTIGEEEGVKFFHVADDTGRQPLPTVAARVAAEAAAAKQRLETREREVIERFLLGELAEELRERLFEAIDLVRTANAALVRVRSSHGKGAHLDWRIDSDATPAARAAVDLLVMSPRSPDEDARLRDALLELIRTERERDPASGYGEHLRRSLDYREWYRFTVQVVDDAKPGSARALSSRLGLSQGEQRVLSYLALFAAASAHYEGLGSTCPRLLLLDDAFAKVDEPTHGRLLALLVELDLDFIITSERMWGCFPDVPSLEIYEALRDPNVPGVALVHFRWDGHRRHLVGL
jgi:uncharacterized protein (TIGR02680 family)